MPKTKTNKDSTPPIVGEISPKDSSVKTHQLRKSHRFSISQLITNIVLLLAIICFAFTVVFIFLTKDTTSKDFFLFGFKPYIITSASMSPELSVNSIVLIQQTSFDTIEVGDIISYRSANYSLPVCHRVIDITDTGLVTQGDNVDLPDQEVITSDMFRGKLIWHTNFFASYIVFVQENGIFLGVILPVLLILGIIIAVNLIPKKSKKKETKDASPSEN